MSDVLPPSAPPDGLLGFTPDASPRDPAIMSAAVQEDDDGGMTLTLDDSEPSDIAAVPHDGNLAEVLPDHVLSGLAADVLEGVENDIDSNSDWYSIVEGNLKLLGLKPNERVDIPYEGAPSATHPVLKEAIVRFAATASGETMPADGPVRCKIFGDATPDQEAKAQRKQGYMNYFLTQEDEDYYDDYDQMLLVLGLHGHVYRKVWRDPLRGGVPTSRFFTAWDVVVSARATTLKGSYPYTEIETISQSDMIRLQRQAWYRDVDIAEPQDDLTPKREYNEKAGWTRPTDLQTDNDHVVYHRYCMLDIDGLEHRDDDGHATGIALPYIVTVERDSQRVLRVARNWDVKDPLQRPRSWFVPFRFMQGLTFMGWGLGHLVGADADTLTMMQRMALVSFALASFPGGLKVKTTKAEDTSLRVAPGEWKDVDTGGMPIRDALMPLPYRDVPGSYSMLSETILQNAQRLASTSDIAVGDSRDDALPGTVLALMKKATELQSAVLKRIRRAQRKEFRMLADLFAASGKQSYPYMLNGQSGQALAADFAENEDVSPVADPNIPTQTERLANAQATLSIAQQSPPGLVDIRAATEDMYRIMGKTDAEIARLMPPPQPPPPVIPADPVSEFMAVQHGAPVKAGPMQDHQAHIQAHIGQLAIPGVLKSPAGPALQAHIADHVGQLYTQQVAKLTGMGPQQGPPGAPPDPQADARISGAVAHASDALRQIMSQLVPNADPNAPDPLAAAELDLKRQALQQGHLDDQRKAFAQARQDQGEALKQNAELQDHALDRENERYLAQLDFQNSERDRAADIEKARIVAQAAAARGRGNAQ